MKLIRLALPAIALACSTAGVAAEGYQPGTKDVPRTARSFAKADSLRFVVIGDRTGQHRPGVFEKAVAQVDRLHPDFVINIGDLIEGNTEDRAQLDAEWTEVNGAISQLRTPFFYVPGNHDLTNDVQRQVWREKLGADFYHFRYKDALFIVLNTEDPPQPKIARRKLLDAYGAEAMSKVLGALQGDPAQAEALFAREPRLGELAAKVRASENVAISTAQVDMVRKALAQNPHPRWTFVLMHRPAWKVASPAFQQIETLLKGRSYTMLAGHFHKYAYERRQGQDYVQLGVTGGMPGGKHDDPAVADHLMWVSLADGPPQISNIRLDGFFDKHGPSPR